MSVSSTTLLKTTKTCVFASQSNDRKGNRDSCQQNANIFHHNSQHPDDFWDQRKDQKIDGNQFSAGDLAEYVKALATQHEDLSLDPSTPCEKRCKATWVLNLHAGGGVENSKIFGFVTTNPALASWRGPVLNKVGSDRAGQPMSSSGLCMMHKDVCIQTCVWIPYTHSAT